MSVELLAGFADLPTRRRGDRRPPTRRLLREWQRHREVGAALTLRHRCDAPVVSDDDLLHQGEAKARAPGLGREEWTEHPFSYRRRDPRPVVADHDAQRLLIAIDRALSSDVRCDTRADAGLERIAKEVTDRLTQQDVISVDARELAANDELAAARFHLRTDIVGTALDHRGHLDRAHDQLGRLGEVQEVRDDLPELLGLRTDTRDI